VAPERPRRPVAPVPPLTPGRPLSPVLPRPPLAPVAPDKPRIPVDPVAPVIVAIPRTVYAVILGPLRLRVVILLRLRNTGVTWTYAATSSANVCSTDGTVYITLCLKKRPIFTTCCNFYIHRSIAIIFGTNVADNIGNQNVLYFPTTPN